MTDPEDPEAKNEQELNLFSDQPQSGEPSGEPEFSGSAAAAEPAVQETVQEAASTAPEQSIRQKRKRKTAGLIGKRGCFCRKNTEKP